LYVLLGCAVRLKVKPHADINLSLKPFGFILGSVVRQPENRDVMLVALTVMAACVFAVAFAAVGLGYLGLWSRSEFFPQTARDPFMLSISAAFIHGIAILTADRVRARRIGKEDWFASVGLVRAPSRANYIRIAFCCAVMGYISLLAWGLMFQGVTADLFKGTLPYVLLPATTGGFYAYHLDNVELGTRPASRLWEIAPQALVTGFFAFAAAKVGFGFIDAPAGIPDVVALVSVLGATVGASLAWYIPTAAQSSRRDPLVEARKERMSALKTAALKRFEDPALADKWLNQPHPALGNRLPKDAAADVESYEHAISQLQQSQHLVLVPSSSAEQPRLSCSV